MATPRSAYCEVCSQFTHNTPDCPYLGEREPDIPYGFHLETLRDDGSLAESIVNPTRRRTHNNND